MKSTISLFIILNVFSFSLAAQMSAFKDGTAIVGFGKYMPISSHTVNADTVLKVAFDVAAPAKAGEVNRKFDSLARFINMHVASGVPIANIELALVVHGKASFDLLNNDAYQKINNTNNANAPLLAALLANNVKVILCGQTAAVNQLTQPQLVKGSHIELSAMTAHALLQQQGYTVNPF